MKRMISTGLALVCLSCPLNARGAPSETWYPVESPTKETLIGVAFAEDGSGFAVGNESTVLRYDGVSWSVLPFPEKQKSLVHAAVRSYDDAWIFSRLNNIVYHYIDGRWESVVFGREFGPLGVDLLHRDLGYAVGLFGMIYRFDGTRWERVIAPNLTNDRESHLHSVAVMAPNDVWIGADQCLLHFDGTNWTRESALPGGALEPTVERIDDAVVLLGKPAMVRRGGAWTAFSTADIRNAVGSSEHLWALVYRDGTHNLERVVPPGASWNTTKHRPQHLAKGKHGSWAVGEHGLILHLEPNTLPSFLDRTFDAGAGVQAESAFALLADIDGTGARDLVLARPFGRNSFLRAEEPGTFRPMPLVTPPVAELPNAQNMAMADIDGDGGVDLVLRRDPEPHTLLVQVWRNLGGFRFWNAPSGIEPVAPDDLDRDGDIEIFDFDGDSDLDIYEVRMLSKLGGFPLPNFLHRNDGFGHFKTEKLYQHDGGAAWAWTEHVSAADLTGDGRTDILALNSWGAGNTFYKQKEDGSYVQATAESGLAGDIHLSLGAVTGDIDNDGALDVLVLTTIDFGPSRLYHNDGHGHFHDVTTESGLDRTFASAEQAQFADMDLDGDLDLLLGNAREPSHDIGTVGRLRLLVNDGTGHFSDATVKANIDQTTSAFVADDFDDDGDIDLYLARSGESNRLLVNEPPGHGYVKVRLETAAPNRVALGAHVSVFRKDGKLFGFRETNWRQPIAHFGVGELTEVDIEVRFPSGRVVRKNGVPTRQEILMTEFSQPKMWAYDTWFFFRHRWAWADARRDLVSLGASISFLVGLWRLSKWLRTRFFVRRPLTMALLFLLFFVVRLMYMPLEPVSVVARILPLSTLISAGLALLVWDRRSTNRADARFVGPYELLSEIGRGGMGIVYRARDTSQSGRPIVALKIMNPDRVRDSSSLRRFVREAEIGAKLNHPGIVSVLASGECRVLDRGTWQSTAYLAMEYIEGTSLASLLTSADRLPLVRSLEILRDAALALSAAHSMGILHRDVKPDNILLSRGGVVKLVDFGIASVLATPSQTEAGFLVGTIAYIPPERVLGRVEDARGDLYSLGVTMYEAISGRRPFDDENMTTAELLRAVLEEQPKPPVVESTQIPLRLNRLVLGLLAKRPDERPSTGQIVAEEIENVLRELRGEIVLSNSLPPAPVLETANASTPAQNVAPEMNSFDRETLDIPRPPIQPSTVPEVDQAFQRETLDLPRDT